MDGFPTVNQDNLLEAMRRLRSFRRSACIDKLDPWAVRQALIIIVEMDAIAAVAHGVKPGDLDTFDDVVRQQARQWVEGKKA